jgi:hypothetical protein
MCTAPRPQRSKIEKQRLEAASSLPENHGCSLQTDVPRLRVGLGCQTSLAYASG